ncbi:MAG: hypothetical protein GY953_40185, partial [bacterium]|nr:hypothetical protein [bacterium]
MLEQNYRYDLVSRQKLLERYLDRDIRIITKHEKVHDGTLKTAAGTGDQGFGGDGGPAVEAMLKWPAGLAIDGEDNLYIHDSGNYRIRKRTPDGAITTICGNGSTMTVDTRTHGGKPATEVSCRIQRAIGGDTAGNLYFGAGRPTGLWKLAAEDGMLHWMNKLNASNSTLSSIAVDGTGTVYGVSGGRLDSYSPGGRRYHPLETYASASRAVAVDGSGSLYLADGSAYPLRATRPRIWKYR